MLCGAALQARDSYIHTGHIYTQTSSEEKRVVFIMHVADGMQVITLS